MFRRNSIRAVKRGDADSEPRPVGFEGHEVEPEPILGQLRLIRLGGRAAHLVLPQLAPEPITVAGRVGIVRLCAAAAFLSCSSGAAAGSIILRPSELCWLIWISQRPANGRLSFAADGHVQIDQTPPVTMIFRPVEKHCIPAVTENELKRFLIASG